MGNSSGKEARPGSSHRGHGRRHPSGSAGPPGADGQPGPIDTSRLDFYGQRTDHPLVYADGSRVGRDGSGQEPRRETKAEREARRLARDREVRARERERSLREEGVDGGYLVTLGTYIGPEDFSKTVVRQLMIERRLAPFWRGLNDHSDSWVEHQLIAAARGLPIPAADEIPPESPTLSEATPESSTANLNHLTVPITSRSQSTQSDRSMNLSSSHPAFASSSSGPGQPPSPSPFFRGRAKTLASSLVNSSRSASQAELGPQEIQLPREQYVNGQRLEVFLYKDAAECPICFLYYPPYLNKTRCCDQPICSECFVQIKRPDPHAPEHHDDPSNPTPPAAAPETAEDAVNLVSEPSQCPFCVQTEFGVTYDAPPFRRGLAYAGPPGSHSLMNAASAMSSTSSLNSQGLASPPAGNRRRTTSLSANAPQVITTDRVRPDWAKKLSDARAHALRRAAAATALHNAAYVLGGNNLPDTRGHGFGRRRRNPFAHDSPSASGRGTPRHGEGSAFGAHLVPLIAAAERQRAERGENPEENDGSGRGNPRRPRMEDIEELMMMEAIRLSLAAEEERKRREEKEAAKEAKKEEKRKAKEDKKAQKAARKGGPFSATSSAMASRSSLGTTLGKGKEVDRSREPPLPTTENGSSSVVVSEESAQPRSENNHQKIGEVEPQTPLGASVFAALNESSHRDVLRQISNDASSMSSVAESTAESFQNASDANAGLNGEASGSSPGAAGVEESSHTDTNPAGVAKGEPMLNFQSLAATVEENEKQDGALSGAVHVEHVPEAASDPKQTGIGAEGKLAPNSENIAPIESAANSPASGNIPSQDDEISPAIEAIDNQHRSKYDQKHYGDVSIVDSNPQSQQITQ